MVIAILQFELLIRGSASLKDKRSVIASLKDRLHREHMVSVAEVAMQDRPDVARMALVLVNADGKYAGQVLDRITAKLHSLHDAELGDCAREILHDPQGQDEPFSPGSREMDHELDAEMVTRAEVSTDSTKDRGGDQ